jgi:hypothetical protein
MTPESTMWFKLTGPQGIALELMHGRGWRMVTRLEPMKQIAVEGTQCTYEISATARFEKNGTPRTKAEFQSELLEVWTDITKRE